MFSPTTPPRTDPRTLRTTFRRAVDAVVSFALLEDVASASDTVDTVNPPHPHRRTPAQRERTRRPGAGVPREQDCLAPIRARERHRQTQTLR